ncbi:cytochrome P450 [Gymnopilus junonius]|uniref:Cytochrome P450 n=1 Tax=Gymnopilus junonius TaxID=109634 RepID=A0A9P5NPE2_GYMJU|nr:cytochrome P450 [Gymnopilus junonius]
MERLGLAAVLSFALIFYLRIRKRRNLRYPPGPRKFPLLGNLLNLPTSFEWETYARWGKEYDSDIIHLQAAGHDLIVLNSVESATDLFDKKSSIYSGRPQFTMVNELMGWDWILPTMAYGERWKERRRLFQKHFSTRNAHVYRATQLEFVRKTLPRLLDHPDDFLPMIRHMAGGISISLAYGLNVQDHDDPFVDLSERAVQSAADAAQPGAFLVDLIPWLKYVPEWVPGARFQKTAGELRQLQEDFRNLPYVEVVKNMSSGQRNVKPSFVSSSLESLDEKSRVEQQKEAIKDTAGAVFAAGTDTTVATLQVFFAAMLCHPQVQRKAQEELDQILGGKRLPEFKDEESLPYITAIVKELMRWQPVGPQGEAMLHDEKYYPEPSIFRPERFLREDGQLSSEVRDPGDIAFGFGRRVCPGNHMASSILWLTVATVLTTFDITNAVDEHGQPIQPSVKYHSGLVYHPLPFKCTIKARSAAAEELVRFAADASR